MGFECIKVPNLKVNVLTLKIHQSEGEDEGTVCINYVWLLIWINENARMTEVSLGCIIISKTDMGLNKEE